MEQGKRWVTRFLTMGLSGVFALTLALPIAAFADDEDDASAEASSAITTMSSLQAQVDQAASDLVEAQQEEADAQAKADEAQQQIETNTQKISDLQDHLSTRARSMYRAGNSSMLDVLMGSTSFSDFITTWDMLDKLNNEDASMVQEAKDLKTQLEQDQATYLQQKEVAEQRADEAEASKSKAESNIAARQAVYSNLSDAAKTTVDATYEASNTAAAEAAAANGMTDTGYSGTTTNNSSSSGAVIGGGGSEMARAAACVGVLYRYGADGSNGDFDCSGFVSYCLTGSFGHAYTTGTLMGYPAVSSPQVGDIVVCSRHCGIWVGPGTMIDASDPCVGYHSYTNGWYMDSDYKIVRP